MLTPKNWGSFQHYKDRSPPWIKLHRGLLDNVDYYHLSAEAAKVLPLIWIIASERDGMIPDAAELAFRLRIAEELASDILSELVERSFLVNGEAEPAEQGATLAQRKAKSNGFGSRHISDATKRVVWERDGGKCCQCGGDENVEYDHKHPVSKGGNSEEDNIQLLCRPCNRSKRNKLATQPLSRRSPEKEGETQEREEKRETRARDDWPIDFKDQFWSEYPHKVGRAAALSKLDGVRKRGVGWLIVMAGLQAYKRDKPADRQWCNPATWLHQDRWTDQPADGQRPTEAGAEMTLEQAVSQFARLGRWSRYAPINDVSQAPADLLAKYGLGPDGRKLEPATLQ